MVQCTWWPGYGRSVDWWSLGVLVHELVTGVTPWRHPDLYTLYDMIIDQEFTWHTGELTAGLWVLNVAINNSVTNPISLAAVISDSRRDRWREWGGGWRDGDHQGFRHKAPGPGCRQGGRERWVFDLLSHQKLFRDLGVAQPGHARLKIIPGSSVSTGTRWVSRDRISIIMTLGTLAGGLRVPEAAHHPWPEVSRRQWPVPGVRGGHVVTWHEDTRGGDISISCVTGGTCMSSPRLTETGSLVSEATRKMWRLWFKQLWRPNTENIPKKPSLRGILEFKSPLSSACRFILSETKLYQINKIKMNLNNLGVCRIDLNIKPQCFLGQ